VSENGPTGGDHERKQSRSHPPRRATGRHARPAGRPLAQRREDRPGAPGQSALRDGGRSSQGSAHGLWPLSTQVGAGLAGL